MVYIEIIENKPARSTKNVDLSKDFKNLITCEYDDYICTNSKYKYDIETNSIILNPDYEEQKARLIKNDLIENVNYNLKSNVAYTGVRFDYGDIELVFETNKDSMSLINFTLTSILTGAMTEVKNWKCRKTTEPYEPLSVDFTIEQFRQIVAFALNMVNSAFNIEKQINEQIEQLSTLQLNNEEYIETFKTQMRQAYNQIPVKIEGLFEAATPTETPTEEPETQPTEEPETT